MTAALVETRWAGGPIAVEPDEYDEQIVVRVDVPGLSVPLAADEAVRLGVELIAAAHRAEHPKVDDWLDDPMEPPC
ncbi:hypothetical protein C1I63_13870 [Rathayibacter caricis DSM 15933]|uniref:Uncharacterized protein n=1 Tax=Rathayibacter caricis DSM 15933 TaxID=1328867 RepID=A0A2T4UWB4_9MICO|nr:hypothetical protein [Rathayibacter caricis]PTL73817.1 hypothetical protein C1I63_13870 [Rathayibacter caricis DSM 15933]